VGSLLLTNSDFRAFVSDLRTIVKEVLQETAFTLSNVSKEAGEKLESRNPKEPQSEQALQAEVVEVGDVLTDSAGAVVQGLEDSILRKVAEDKDTLLDRLQKAILSLRKRGDYSDSVSTLSLLLRRFALAYSHIGSDIVETLEEDVHTNGDTDRALKNFWTFLTSFGDRQQWNEVESRAKGLLEQGRDDPQFDKLVNDAGRVLQDMFLDPKFFENAEERFAQLRHEFRRVAADSSLREDADQLLETLSSTVKSVMQDGDIVKLIGVSEKIANILSPANQYVNGDLLRDAIHIFVPRLVESVQYIPIPRVEISTPEIDLLLENLILEPGVTVNQTSFLPYRLRLVTQNSVDIRKARFRTTSSVESLVTIKIAGLSVCAEDMGFWLRAHSGILRLVDQGVASFYLDERGIDIELDVEIAREHVEHIVTLHAVRVRIHKLAFTLRQSKFALLTWLFKPLLQPIIRRTMEIHIAAAIADGLRAANRELVYARERLRAARIANPDDLWTFVKAVATRFMPEGDPKFYSRVGVDEPGRGVFKGVYAPGSLVKLWHEDVLEASHPAQGYKCDGWRNDIFDAISMPAL
jgi:Family of unknown function (DUF5923)/Protein of unknown function (DUF4449)